MTRPIGWVGAAAAGTVALALLVAGCVFAAMAGPALSLHTRTQALRQTLAGLPSADKTVQMTAGLADFTNPNGYSETPQQQQLTGQQLEGSASELGGGLAAAGLPLTAGAWAGLTTRLMPVASGAGPGAQAGTPPELEVVYRDRLPVQAALLAGSYASTAVPAGAVAVAATAQTAARFGLRPGSVLTLASASGTAKLAVTAIVRQRDPGSAFWTLDPTVAAPSLNTPPQRPAYWAGGVFADPGQFGAMQDAFGGDGMTLGWVFPLAVGGVTADQAQALHDDLNRATTAAPGLAGQFQQASGTVTVTSPLIADLTVFLAAQSATETVLLLLFVSLALVGVAVVMLAGRMIVAAREGELTALRARGGSLRQIAAATARGALIAAVPGALLGAALAMALVPGGTRPPPQSWALAGVALAAGLAGPPLLAAWRHRRPAPAANPARITTAETRTARVAWRRPVAEVTACAAAALGLVVLHDQGLSANGGADFYLSAAPVLVAVPVVLVMLRLYPLAMRGLRAASSRRAGVTGFVGLARAASPGAVLPAFALVLALGLASFAGMVGDGIARGEAAASWQRTGADVVIQPDLASGPAGSAAVRAIAAVPGVRAATAVWATQWQTAGGQQVTVLAVDPVGYAALVAGTPFPSFPAARLGSATGGTGGTVPVLASPSAAAALGRAATRLLSPGGMGPVTVRVAGTLGATPAQPGGGAFLVMALRTLPGQDGRPAPDLVLVNGAAIDQARLSAVASRVLPGSVVTFRAAVLASLADSPLQHGAAVIITLTIAAVAAFGLFIVIAGLALGSAERELAVARLTVMGHDRAAGLVLAEAMPAVLAAVVAGAACAAALPALVGSSIDLSAFTGTGAAVQLRPGAAALGLPAAAIVALAAAALAAEAGLLRRRGVTAMLRAR